MDLPLPESNALAKLIPDKPGISLRRVLRAPIDASTKEEKSLKEKEELREEDLVNVRKIRELLEEDGTLISKVLQEAEKLEGSVRNTGIHAAGIIIAPKDLSELIPVSSVKDINLLITQFEGNVIESSGVIKMDFLGLKTLSIIRDALDLIKRNHGVSIAIDDIPLDDEATYTLYQQGDTNATFQFESAGMQKHLRDLKPDKFADLIAMNALYRPGPIQYIPSFIRRKHGEETITYDLPEMEELLADTYGITVYQEQVMLLSQSIGGFSKGDADILRKAMGKKKKEVLDKMKIQFINGATAKGHPKEKLEKIWSDWEAFAQYAFNKSHSTCYAFVAYQTAYLKAHYPSEYMAAVMNNANSIDKITFFMKECQRMGIKVLGPDVNESLKGFAVNKEGTVRFGLGAIKGVGDAAVENILEEREANGGYQSVFDLIMRVNQRAVSKKSLEALALGGALDCFTEYHRAQYFYTPANDPQSGLERVIRFGAQFQAAESLATNSLFGADEMPEITPPELPDCDPWPLHELLEKEKDTIGIYLSGHPLDGFRFEMEHYHIVPINELEQFKGRQVRLAGFIASPYHGISKKGDKYGRMVLTDYTGTLELNFWRENYVRYKDYIEESQKVMVTGVYDESRFRPGQMEFKIDNVMLLSDVKGKLSRRFSIALPLNRVDEPFVHFMRQNMQQYPGKCELNILVSEEEQNKTTLRTANGRILPNDDLIEYLTESSIPFNVEAM
jgi:DNA polymerase-3 subunit alpha